MDSQRQFSDEMAWAVWLRDGRDDELVAVTAKSESEAVEKANQESEVLDDDPHVDGPFEASEPGYFEFEFVTEHRETVVVEAPNEDYARETAENQRDYSGRYVQTIRSDCTRRVPKGGDGDD